MNGIKVNKIKKLLCIIIASLMGILSTGCSGITEINQRSIVHVVGIDKVDGEYEVSLQIFSTAGAGSDTPIDVSKSNTRVITARGRTVYEGIKGCEYILGGDIFMGHNKFIIFGSSLYDEDMWQLLDWFRKENENYLGVTVAYSETSAKDILEVKLTEGASAVENMKEVHEYAVKSGTTTEGDLLVLFNHLSETSGAGLLPVFSVIDEKQSSDGSQNGSESEEQTQYLEIKKTAVLKDKKLAGFLNHQEMAGVLWLTDQMEKNTVTLEAEGTKFNAELKSKGTKSKLYIEDGKAVIECQIRIEAKAAEEITDPVKTKVCALVQEKVTEQCKRAVQKTVNEMNTDVLRIEKLTKFYQPSLFNQYSKDFSRVINSTDFRLSVICEITD